MTETLTSDAVQALDNLVDHLHDRYGIDATVADDLPAVIDRLVAQQCQRAVFNAERGLA